MKGSGFDPSILIPNVVLFAVVSAGVLSKTDPLAPCARPTPERTSSL